MKTTIITNGRVVDPKQNLDKTTNIIICDGKIHSITDEISKDIEATADTVIDALGKVVSPGFIDIHMHEDECYGMLDSCISPDNLSDDMSTSVLHMGVTLDIAGNCGDNECDPEKLLDYIDSHGAPVNMGLLVGHTWLRNLHGHKDKYKPITSAEIEKMVSDGKYYLDKGCLGISFGLKYIPGTTWDEIISLSELCQKSDKLVAAHVRADVDGVYDAADELARMGKDAGVKVQFSHIGSMGGYGQMSKLLEMIKSYRENGIDMLCDCYPYNAFSTGIGETTYDDGFLESYQADYDSILIVNGKYAGQRCTKEIFEDLRKNAPNTGTVGYFMKGEDVDEALMSPLVMLGSDGVRHEGKGHPRASGAFARFICNYIATEKISLIDGISKMTTMAADRLNLTHKGNLLPGSDADIVIFDLKKVKDLATYEDGQIPSEGFNYVLIDGEVALKDDKIINAHLGKSVRR